MQMLGLEPVMVTEVKKNRNAQVCSNYLMWMALAVCHLSWALLVALELFCETAPASHSNLALTCLPAFAPQIAQLFARWHKVQLSLLSSCFIKRFATILSDLQSLCQ